MLADWPAKSPKRPSERLFSIWPVLKPRHAPWRPIAPTEGKVKQQNKHRYQQYAEHSKQVGDIHRHNLAVKRIGILLTVQGRINQLSEFFADSRCFGNFFDAGT